VKIRRQGIDPGGEYLNSPGFCSIFQSIGLYRPHKFKNKEFLMNRNTNLQTLARLCDDVTREFKPLTVQEIRRKEYTASPKEDEFTKEDFDRMFGKRQSRSSY
jgi:hypothetical protein